MKAKGPLFSKEARGTIADVLTFSHKRTGQQVRFQKKQKDANTLPQGVQRLKFLNASTACRFFEYGVAIYGVSLYGTDKSFYDEKAEKKEMTGYNLCIADYLKTI